MGVRFKAAVVVASGAVALAGCALIAGVEDGELAPAGGGTSVGGGGTSAGGGGTSAGGGGTSAGGGGTSAGGGGSGGNPSGCVGSVPPGMTEIPAGTFSMGCNTGVDDRCYNDEDPYHDVTLSCFRMDTTEVTRSAYLACMTAGSCTEPGCDWSPTGLPDHPVTCVTWNDAAAYCTWAGMRLPTEAQWEYAARGTTGHRYPWGNTFGADCSLVNGNLCRLDAEDVGSHPTGASPFGLLDMAGNVAEWVNDFYSQEYYASSPATDPTGPTSGGTRVIRGGGWNSNIRDFRTSYRDANVVGHHDDETGFRCAQ